MKTFIELRRKATKNVEIALKEALNNNWFDDLEVVVSFRNIEAEIHFNARYKEHSLYAQNINVELFNLDSGRSVLISNVSRKSFEVYLTRSEVNHFFELIEY